jgi:hypothetical protein
MPQFARQPYLGEDTRSQGPGSSWIHDTVAGGSDQAPNTKGVAPERGSGSDSLEQAVEAACELVAPLWPLRHFVAVNPWLGLTDSPFRKAVGQVDRLFHGRALMPTSFYRAQHALGRITVEDVDAAIAEAPRVLGRPDLERAPALALRQAMSASPSSGPGDRPRVYTLAEAVDRESGSSWARVAVDGVARWCAARFDGGQAAWKQPWGEDPIFAAWREVTGIDRLPEIHGISGFRAYVKALPAKPMDAIRVILDQLGIPAEGQRDFLARQLTSVAGWAGHVRYLVRQAAFAGRHDDALVHLLAIRLAYDGGLDRALAERAAGARAAVVASLDAAMPVDAGRDAAPADAPLLDDEEVRMLWQLAYESAYRTGLLERLGSAGRAGRGPRAGRRPALQAVFCIDVRSERLRRHLEAVSPDIETIGFAGFFGVPIEYVRVGDERGAARCPALIAPAHRIRERGPGGGAIEARVVAAGLRHRLFHAARKLSVGAFPLVETLGHFFGARLVTDSFGWTRPEEGGALFAPRGRDALAPDVAAAAEEGADFGLSLRERIDWAEATLRGMGLTRRFAEVVVLCGHGSRSTNNPYASGLDCGACGGHAGDVNARVAAEILESPEVREGLAERGIVVPADTRFVAGLHETTCDEITLYGAERLSDWNRRRIGDWLRYACEDTRKERAGDLGERPRRGLLERLRRRSRDWSEVRPEWGLAGNAAFVAASRVHTRGLDLEGRVFLHDYDVDADERGEVLEVILSAPMVVASWINLQYYASTVDNEVFGSGDKVLQNVVGRHGVMLGNRSDLKTGLPWQSVHDGERYVHEPMRLTVVVAASRDRIERVLANRPEVRELVDNGWVHLIAWSPDEDAFHAWSGQGGWRAVEREATRVR